MLSMETASAINVFPAGTPGERAQDAKPVPMKEQMQEVTCSALAAGACTVGIAVVGVFATRTNVATRACAVRGPNIAPTNRRSTALSITASIFPNRFMTLLLYRKSGLSSNRRLRNRDSNAFFRHC